MSKELSKANPTQEREGDLIRDVILNLNEQIQALRDRIGKNPNLSEY